MGSEGSRVYYSGSFIGLIMRLANKGEVFLGDSEVSAIETALSNS
jgi:hypothetical protein